jgi:hypothetical protein
MQTVLTHLTGGIKDKKPFIRGSLKGLRPFTKNTQATRINLLNMI